MHAPEPASGAMHLAGTPGPVRDLGYIDALRAVGSIAVVVHHAVLVAQTRLFGMTADLVLFDYFAGSAIFSVITPVLMLLTAPGRGDDWRAYVVRRAIRLIPLYLAVTLATFAYLRIYYYGVGPLEAFMSPGKLLASLLLVATVFYERPVVYAGWTLEYIVYLHVAVILAARAGDRVWRWTLALMAALVTLRLGLPAGMPGAPMLALTNGILAPLAVGIVTGLHVTRRVVTPDAIACVAVAIGAMGARHVLQGESLASVYSSLAAAGLVLVLHAWRADIGRAGVLAGVVRALGRMSYALYICHGLAISVTAALLIRLDAPRTTGVFVGVEIAAALVAGWCVHRYAEGHVIRWSKRAAARVAGWR